MTGGGQTQVFTTTALMVVATTISVTTNKNPIWILCDMSAISKLYRILKWDGGLKNRRLLR